MTTAPHATTPEPGPVAWMVHNRVTPNLLMLVLIVGGLFVSTRIRQEVFPQFDLDIVTVQVAYPGASPEEIERGLITAIEEAVRGIEGVEEVVATASEGLGMVSLELLSGAAADQALEDVRQAVDRITTFPEDAEEPAFELVTRRREVLAVQIYGDTSEWVLREVAEQVRDRLLQNPEITQVDLEGARNYEIHVDVPMERARAHGLTLGDVARRIAATSVELPGGRVETRGGEILLRVTERRDWAREFGEIPIVTTAAGTVLRLRDLGTIRDEFEDVDRFATFDGLPAVVLTVFQVGDQTPIGVSAAAREVLADLTTDLPPGIAWAVRRDRSEIYEQRLQLLLKNALIGLVLVLILLSCFLEFRLAFWVTMGIPTSFLGALLFLPALGVSINMISLFAFLIALGIVVDDAIVAGENIYAHRLAGHGLITSAIQGAREVALPVGFSILTNIVAFLPLMFVPGFMGKVWGVIPWVVTTVFLISWVEALFILPSHLGHVRERPRRGWQAALHERQRAFSDGFVRGVARIYGPLIESAIRGRYLTVAIAVALLVVAIAWAASGRMGFMLMPTVESDRAVVTARLPFGSPLPRVLAVHDQLVAGAFAVAKEHGGTTLTTGIGGLVQENVVEAAMYLTDPAERPLGTAAVTRAWRERVGTLPGVETVRYEADRGGPGGGPALTVELSHREIAVLERASRELAATLSEFGGVTDIDDGQSPGKPQLDFRLTLAGRSLGLTSADVARQVRDAFYGAEALRQQRGRNEVKVLVRLPEAERASEYDIEELIIRTPAGREVPLPYVAAVEHGRAYTAITRRDGRRTALVTANVAPPEGISRVLTTLNDEVLPELARAHPGLTYSFEGRQAEMRDSMRSLLAGFGLALAVIYVLLAIPFRSYTQPLIVMTAIPFGIFGAIIGHVLMGYSLSVISIMGMVALAGVVVNDALVMIDYANRARRRGEEPLRAIREAGVRRFRPIFLTTVTTFGGLAPMIFETSRQARFMIPMAISLGYGILFASAITLLLVPCLYVIVEDVRAAVTAGARTVGEAVAAPADSGPGR